MDVRFGQGEIVFGEREFAGKRDPLAYPIWQVVNTKVPHLIHPDRNPTRRHLQTVAAHPPRVLNLLHSPHPHPFIPPLPSHLLKNPLKRVPHLLRARDVAEQPHNNAVQLLREHEVHPRAVPQKLDRAFQGLHVDEEWAEGQKGRLCV